MKQELLNLHFAQLKRIWNKSQYNNYADKSKNNYHKNLTKLFECLENENFSNLTPVKILEIAVIIDFFFRNLEFLDNSTLNVIPFEMVQCLTIALNDWRKKDDKFIIVTSFSNDVKEFALIKEEASRKIYNLIEKTYKIKFEKRLIQIILPKYLSKDYMANVVLYHELGHFIDEKYEIVNPVFEHIYENIKLNNIKKDDLVVLYYYLPYLKTTGPLRFYYLKQHLKEYFADIFASQYIDNSSIEYLNFIDYFPGSKNITSKTHPSTINRTELVDVFLTNQNNYIINLFNDSIHKILNKHLEKKYEVITENDFIKLIPYENLKRGQLHYLFVSAWQHWLFDFDKFKEQNKMEYDFKYEDLHQILNNLVEKSIGNYLIESHWKRKYATI
jgi:hypothetical protein